VDTKKFKLTIELVPKTAWFTSLYQIYKKTNHLSEWRRIKEELFEKEGRQCWICGKENTRLEAHEFWEYDDENHVMKLVAIHHLCDMCHKIKHIGFWRYTLDGRKLLEKAGITIEDIINHFCKVNNCTREEFEKHKEEAFKKWKERSRYKWKIDLGKYTPSKEILEAFEKKKNEIIVIEISCKTYPSDKQETKL